MIDGSLPPAVKNLDLCTWEKCDNVKVIGEGFTNVIGDLSCQIKTKKVSVIFSCRLFFHRKEFRTNGIISKNLV